LGAKCQIMIMARRKRRSYVRKENRKRKLFHSPTSSKIGNLHFQKRDSKKINKKIIVSTSNQKGSR